MTSRTFADSFAGTSKINDCHRLIGAIVTSLGGVEETLLHLDWNLRAFKLAANMAAGTSADDVVRALQPDKTIFFSKYRALSRILQSIDVGIVDASVAASLRTDAASFAARWHSYRTTALDLGNRRNAVAHRAVGLTGASPVRGMGFNVPSQPYREGDDERLVTDIGVFNRTLLAFVEELGAKLPFRDNVRVYSATATI